MLSNEAEANQGAASTTTVPSVESALKSIVLYHGDNGEQEFWSSTAKNDNERLVLRNHRDRIWTAFKGWIMIPDTKRQKEHPRKTKAGSTYYVGGRTPEEALSEVMRETGEIWVLSKKMVWVKNTQTRNGMPMKLIPTRHELTA